jgi:competence protein ComEC
VFASAVVLAGWWWGSVRLEALDRSPLAAEIGRAERALVVVTAPVKRGSYALRVQVRVLRFGDVRPHEPALLELPLGRSPPQGGILDVLGVIRSPRGPVHGFDERTWLRRHGMHVVLHGDSWSLVGRRGGLGGLSDRLRERVERALAEGVGGERRAVLAGVVLGDDGGLSQGLRQAFQASGLYHLLAVSGQNVALVAAGALLLAFAVGIPRLLAEVLALLAIGGYVLAVGPQPSVVRAGVAGALCSLAYLLARPRDRTYFLLLGALALLAWNPYTLLDPGFQLSFVAVIAIFVLVPPISRRLEGYPLPGPLAEVVAVSGACGIATAPILWLQFHRISLLTIPANALAAPAVVPLLGLALVAALVAPVAPAAAAALAWLDGWCAAYLASCARAVASLPLAQITSGTGALALVGLATSVCAYAWRRSRWT